MALKKLDLSVPKEDLISEETLGNLLSWQNVVKYYSLRLMLAPLIETVILLDRKAYLLEKGIISLKYQIGLFCIFFIEINSINFVLGFLCKIVAAFDPEISPRNQLLISEKP